MMSTDNPASPTTLVPSRAPAGAKAQLCRSTFIPMLLMSLALTSWLAFQSAQQFKERQQLGQLEAILEPQLQAATKLRASLDLMATSTAKLASDGNGNARVVVEELRKRGVTINLPAAAKPQ